jgi:hypothetical protein
MLSGKHFILARVLPPNPLNKEGTGIRHESSLKKGIKGDPDLYEKYSLISRYT